MYYYFTCIVFIVTYRRHLSGVYEPKKLSLIGLSAPTKHIQTITFSHQRFRGAVEQDFRRTEGITMSPAGGLHLPLH